ncbi:sirohydrochlorin ferrochelatase [Allonocardiopsis opalescens]|uniref:Sirohydrochlorin ferrochelatase n=1 Tax=Allonocardiopsis opalescens TaxID=1144618 RepID=A0A2T0PU94_9ACTN|nr:sirohydrochlorin ferrochelatase [Allonocardiopsis opalescens]
MPGPAPLVAVAHGSRDPRAEAVVRELAARAAAGRRGLRVRAAFLDHTAPSLPEALAALAAEGAGEAVVVPLLLTAAYHSAVDIPRALAGVREELPWLRVRTAPVLGPHPAFTRVLGDRLAAAGAHPDPGTAVVLAAAGSADPAANAAVARVARDWAARGEGWHSVVPAYASAAAPTPAEAVRERLAAGAARVAVATYLLAPGLFADRVRRDALSAGAYAVSPVLGADPRIAGVVVHRYSTALREPAVRG